jgi:hypothetical protein
LDFTGFPPSSRAGDSYHILRATACIDQPNRSGGTLYSGNPSTPASAANQTLDPAYEFDNAGYKPAQGNVNAGPETKQLIANRDWYTDGSAGTPHLQTSATSPFNGTSGVGVGTVANRPTTCTKGVGYWTTNEGSWNTAGKT